MTTDSPQPAKPRQDADLQPKPKTPIARFVLPLSAVQLLHWGTIYYGWALFLVPVEQEFGWSRADTSGVFSAALVAWALAAVPIGRLIDRGAGRVVMTLGSAAAGLLLLGMSFVQSLPALYGLWICLGIAMGATLYEPLFAVVRRTYGADYARGILIISFLGGLAGSFGFPLVHALIDGFGWRTALVILGAVNLALGAPIHWLLLPKEKLAPPSTRTSGGPETRGPLRAALAMPVFWALAVVFATSGAIFSAVSLHLVPYLMERGYDVSTAVAVASIIGISQTAGRVVLFATGGRIDFRMVGIVAFLAPIGGVAILAGTTANDPLIWAFPVLYGLGVGLKTIVQATAGPSFIGSEGYGAIQGAFAAAGSLSRAAAPILAAFVSLHFGGADGLAALFIALAVSAFAAYLVAMALASRGR